MPIVVMPDGTHVDMPDQPDEGVLGYLKTMAHGAVKGLAGLPATLLDNYGDLAKANMEADLSAGKALTGQKADGKGFDAAVDQLRNNPNQRMTKKVDQLANFVGHEPRTTGQDFAHSAAEGAAGGIMGPGGVVKNAVIGASAGLGGETSAKLLQDDTPLNRVLGAIVGGAVPIVGGKLLPNNAEKVIKSSVGQMSNEDWKKAEDLKKFMTEQGMTHSNAQLLGPNSTLDDVFEKASTNQFVRPQVLKKLDNASSSAHEAFNNWTAGNLPPSGAGTRETLLDVQKAASEAIDKLYGKSNELYAKNLPWDINMQSYSPKQVNQIATTLKDVASDPARYGQLSAGGDFIRGIASDLESTVKPKGPASVPLVLGLDGKPLVMSPGPVAPNLPKGDVNNLLKTLNTRADKEGYAGLPLGDVKGVLRDATPEFQAARDAKSAFIKQNVNPVEQSLAGQLSQMGGGVKPDKYTANAQAISMVFPSNRRQPNEIVQLGKDIGADNVGKLFAEHVAQVAESHFKDTKNIAGQMTQPFDFKASLAGTNAQRQNINAALKVVAESNGMPAKSVQDGFFKLMGALDSYKDLKIAGGVGNATEQAVKSNYLSAMAAPLSRTGRYIEDAVMARTYRKIAQMVTDPKGLEQLRAIGQSGNHAQAQAYVRSVMAATAAENQTEDNKPAE